MSDSSAARDVADAVQILASTGHIVLAIRMVAIARTQRRIFIAQDRVNRRQAKLDARTDKLVAAVDLVILKQIEEDL